MLNSDLLSSWISRRLPRSSKVTLDRGRVFIFPSRVGFAFFVLLVLIWLAATNYENSLVYGFAFLLTSFFVVSIFHSFANISGLEIAAVRASPAFAGEKATFHLSFSQQGNRFRDSIHLHYPGAGSVTFSLPGVEQVQVEMEIPATQRGWLFLERLTLESHYPVGLLRVWTYLNLDMKALVYPKPIDGLPIAQRASGRGDSQLLAAEGSEDFVELKRYRPGESLQHIAWKHYAREQGLLSKHYADPADEKVWIDWESFPGMDQEPRLSRLCGLVLKASQDSSLQYGLRLPELEIVPANGDAHRDRLLKELALFRFGVGSRR